MIRYQLREESRTDRAINIAPPPPPLTAPKRFRIFVELKAVLVSGPQHLGPTPRKLPQNLPVLPRVLHRVHPREALLHFGDRDFKVPPLEEPAGGAVEVVPARGNGRNPSDLIMGVGEWVSV